MWEKTYCMFFPYFPTYVIFLPIGKKITYVGKKHVKTNSINYYIIYPKKEIFDHKSINYIINQYFLFRQFHLSTSIHTSRGALCGLNNTSCGALCGLLGQS